MTCYVTPEPAAGGLRHPLGRRGSAKEFQPFGVLDGSAVLGELADGPEGERPQQAKHRVAPSPDPRRDTSAGPVACPDSRT
jgi:hypothetical protein